MSYGNSCYFQSRGRAGPISANMTNVGDCRDAHGASKERLRVGGFEGIDHAASQRGTLSRNEFLPLETLVTREGRTGRVMGPSGGERETEVLQTLKWLHVSFLAGDNIRAVFPSYGNMFNSPSSTACIPSLVYRLVLSDGKA